jgi:UDP-N-acetylglucosamine enolpyruvyl transferase
MSTLLIEGGQRLSGSVEVEGNKNAALPLLAACLLTKDECVLTNVPRISDVEVMARLILDLGGEVEGIGSTTLRVRCPEIIKDEPDRCCCSDHCWRGEAVRTSRRPAVIFRHAGRSQPTSRRWRQWGRGS